MAKTMTTERKLNKLLSAAGILLCAICVMILSVLPVSAAEESGSLTLRCVFSVESGERALADDCYSLVKIADAVITDSSVSYVTLEEFESYYCDWEDQAASKMNEKAKALASFCERSDLYTKTLITDENGELKFESLDIGLYLAVRTKVDPKNEDFITDPLLFFVPQRVNGELIYDIVATPKFSTKTADNVIPDTPKTPSDGTLPQTGQLMWPIGLLAVLGCFLILGGSALLRRGVPGEK